MKNSSGYDVRQLMLMLDCINSFEKKLVDLNSLIGTLEFLFSVMEIVDSDFEDNFLSAVGALEEINAIELINKNEKDYYEINPIEKKKEIENAILKLKNLIKNRLNEELFKPMSEIKDTATELGENWLMCPLCQEVWENTSEYAMIICPKCAHKLHNPKFKP